MDWDARYGEAGYVYGTAPNEFLTAVTGRIPPGRVLCLAEGEGRNAVFLASQGYDVVAVDASQVGLQKASALASARGVALTLVHADLATFAIEPRTWSGIVSVFAHLPPALRARLHRGVVAGLRPGGAFVLEAFTPAQAALDTGGPREPDLLMSLDTLLGELDGLEFEIARELEREVVEGRYHRGRSAVVQVVGRKPVA